MSRKDESLACITFGHCLGPTQETQLKAQIHIEGAGPSAPGISQLHSLQLDSWSFLEGDPCGTLYGCLILRVM